MGEAKRRRVLEKQAAEFVRPISRNRFNVYTMGTRISNSAFVCEELSWWTVNDDALLGIVIRDAVDNDYAWMLLARDEIGRLRCVYIKIDFRTQEFAERQLWVAMAQLLNGGGIKHIGRQGDLTNSPVDPFLVARDVPVQKVHPYFNLLASEEARAPARKVISELALWLAPKDPHFVREFQTSGFDQRLWEMFLWAAFRELYLDVDQLDAPDFRCRAPGVDFTVEATTVGPSTGGALHPHPDPKTPEEREKFLRDYMPMKFGSALTAKLNKVNASGQRYWERELSIGKPFIIAIADCHRNADEDNLGPMTYTQSALYQYLYGARISWRFAGDDLLIDTVPVSEHVYNEKAIPSGFFDLAGAEHVSAVLFSNARTVAKFNRMGVAAGFGADSCRYFRIGLKHNPDPSALNGEPFSIEVRSEGYTEYWSQELQVFHNPNAIRPFPMEALLGASHHFFINGQIKSLVPEDAILSSFTTILKVEK